MFYFVFISNTFSITFLWFSSLSSLYQLWLFKIVFSVYSSGFHCKLRFLLFHEILELPIHHIYFVEKSVFFFFSLYMWPPVIAPINLFLFFILEVPISSTYVWDSYQEVAKFIFKRTDNCRVSCRWLCFSYSW